MLGTLKSLLAQLEVELDCERQARIRELHRKALAWEPIDKPPLRLSHPFSWDGEFVPYRADEICDDPEKMLFLTARPFENFPQG